MDRRGKNITNVGRPNNRPTYEINGQTLRNSWTGEGENYHCQITNEFCNLHLLSWVAQKQAYVPWKGKHPKNSAQVKKILSVTSKFYLCEIKCIYINFVFKNKLFQLDHLKIWMFGKFDLIKKEKLVSLPKLYEKIIIQQKQHKQI